MVADMLVGFKALREKFTSRVLKMRPNRIEVIYLDGPMRDLDNVWEFRPTEEGGCEIDFKVEFTFRNAMFEALAGQYFDRAFAKMVTAFEERANKLYGSSSSSATSAA
jgi:coenzyme Q-binding protein COQ10